MNPEDYPAGTVAEITFPGDRGTMRLGIRRGRGTQWYGVTLDNPDKSGMTSSADSVRPLLVLDNRTIEDLADSLGLGYPTVRRAVQRVLNRKYPPTPTVYEHIVAHDNSGVLTSLCGKVWRPGPYVAVDGRCPECTDRIANWRA